jgi:RNA polymerase sigma-70 factor (ECF subfamily)
MMSAWLDALPISASEQDGHDDSRPSMHREGGKRLQTARAGVGDAEKTTTVNRTLSLPDSEIVARIREGDAGLYGRLFEAYWTTLCEVARFNTHSSDDAREIVADVFAAVWQRRQEWNVTSTVEAYLFSAVRHRGQRMYRDVTHRHALLSAHLRPDWETTSLEGHQTGDTGNLTDATDRRLTLDRIVQTLPTRARLAIYLRWYRELEYREIGEILGISAEAARKLTTRTLDTIRERLRAKG